MTPRRLRRRNNWLWVLGQPILFVTYAVAWIAVPLAVDAVFDAGSGVFVVLGLTMLVLPPSVLIAVRGNTTIPHRLGGPDVLAIVAGLAASLAVVCALLLPQPIWALPAALVLPTLAMVVANLRSPFRSTERMPAPKRY